MSEYKDFYDWTRVDSLAELPSIPSASEILQANSGRWEVENSLVTPELAVDAGQVAKWIIKHADTLPYAETLENEGTRSFTRIGIFDPEEYPTEHSIFGCDRSTEWVAPLLDVIGEVQVRWPKLRHADYAYIDSYSALAGGLPYHQDFHHSDVAVVELLYGSVVSLHDRKSATDIIHEQGEGDAYYMRLTENRKWSPGHEVILPLARLSLRMVAESPQQS